MRVRFPTSNQYNANIVQPHISNTLNRKDKLQRLRLTHIMVPVEGIRNIDVDPRRRRAHIVGETGGVGAIIGIDDEDSKDVARVRTSGGQRHVDAGIEAVLRSEDEAVDVLTEDQRPLTVGWWGALLPFERALGIVADGQFVECDWAFG